MKKQETARILATLRAAYPNVYRNMEEADTQATINLWDRMLKNYSYKVVESALLAFIANDNRGFAPVPGQIIDVIIKFSNTDQQMTEMEAWKLVSRALKNAIYGAEEEFEKLPPVVQSTVGSPQMLRNWGMMDIEEVQTVVQSNFMRSFKARQKNDKEFRALPSDVKEVFDMLGDSMEMTALENKMEKYQDIFVDESA